MTQIDTETLRDQAERCRYQADIAFFEDDHSVLSEAADTIEALRAKLAEERALTDQLADALHHMVNASLVTDQAADAALAAYDAARGKIGGAV